MATRWIGYAEFHAKHCDYSRGLFLKEARAGVWGPCMETPAGVKVSEAAVIRWKQDLGRTTRAIVRERIGQENQPENVNGPAVERAKRGRAGVALAGSETSTP